MPAASLPPLPPSYMALKNAKLREQFEANMFQTAQRSDLFQGVVIFVNGHTSPSALVGIIRLLL